MGYRCNDCNKLCSVEQGEPEIFSDETREEDGSMYVTAEVRLVLTSGCCGSEVAEANLELSELEIDLTHEHDKAKGAQEFDVDLSAEATDRYEGKGRGQRHFYGATVEATAKCSCGWSNANSGKVEEQASSFEKLE